MSAPVTRHSRTIVQITGEFQIDQSENAESIAIKARNKVLDWLTHRYKVQLPKAAFDGENFELDVADSLPVSAVRFDNFWALQFDYFDKNINSRIWRTEATIASTESTVLGGLRLTLLHPEPTLSFRRSVPAIVMSWIKEPGIHDYGVKLSDHPKVLEENASCQELISLILNPRRTRPVVVFSKTPEINVLIEAREAAKRLAGLAHIYVIADDHAEKLSSIFGREFSVWGGAIRTYYAGFNPEIDEIITHPVATRKWLKKRFSDINLFWQTLFISFTALSMRSATVENDLPTFRTIKQASLKHALNHAKRPLNNEHTKLLEEKIELLEQEVREKTEEYNYADSVVKTVENERDQYREKMFYLQGMLERLRQKCSKDILNITYPASIEEIDVWAKNNFPGRLLLLNRAIRAAQKSRYSKPELIYKCLARLAQEYVDARTQGRPVDTLFNDLGVSLERTGEPQRLSEWKEKYFVPFGGKNQFLEYHLKKGSDHNEANTLRIYFFYDQVDAQVVVGHLPSHLRNSQT